MNDIISKRGPCPRAVYSRFIEKTLIVESGCWEWQTAKKRRYGIFAVYVNGEWKTIRAHRASWALHRGAIPEGMHVLHTCDNKRCVNPEHLELGSKSKNTKDAWERGLVGPWARKINFRIAQQICQATGTQSEIAAAFGISQSMVSSIRRGDSWLEPELSKRT